MYIYIYITLSHHISTVSNFFLEIYGYLISPGPSYATDSMLFLSSHANLLHLFIGLMGACGHGLIPGSIRPAYQGDLKEFSSIPSGKRLHNELENHHF